MKKLYRTPLLLGLIVASVVCGFAPGTQALTADNGIGLRPANPQPGNTRSSSIFVYTLKPGETKTDQAQLINNTTSEKQLQVYAVDSQVSSGGAYACAQMVDKAVDVGSWITLSSNEETLPKQSTKDVSFTIKVPADAAPGEHDGCIAVQVKDQKPVSQGNGVTIAFRSALRVAITIPGHIVKGLNFIGTGLSQTEQGYMATVALSNTGNVSLDTKLQPHLSGPLGIGKRAQPSATYPVLAKSTGTFNILLSKPSWGGLYTFSVDATYNSDVTKSVGENGATKTIHSKSKMIWIAPTGSALLVEVLVLILLAALLLFALRGKIVKRLHRHTTTYTVAQGDSLQSIARAYHIKWQTLARINGLKPPYHLESGSTIQIPSKPVSETKPVQE